MAYINYLLLDAARMGNQISEAKKLNSSYVSLFNSTTEHEQEDVAPYIFSFDPESEFARWYMSNGWGNGWGIMARSYASIEDLRTHFRKFLLTVDDLDQEIYFRFYDPRVLTIFLPNCTPDQLVDFLGPIDYLMIEDHDASFGQLIWMENSKFRIKKIDKDEIESRFQFDLSHLSVKKSSGTGIPLNSPTLSSASVGLHSSTDTNEVKTEVNKVTKRNKFFFEE